MKISILITSNNHRFIPYLKKWCQEKSENNQVDVLHSQEELNGGDILFLISCSEVISKANRKKFTKTLVIHASDLPKGRGWSPHVWEIINGATEITLSLIEAEDKVDSGNIWKKIKVHIPETALFDEINKLIFDAEVELMSFAVSNFSSIKTIKQNDADSSYWPKRSPKDSEIDLKESFAEQFDLIRVCDPEAFPAFFYKNGQKFNVIIKKENE